MQVHIQNDGPVTIEIESRQQAAGKPGKKQDSSSPTTDDQESQK